MTNVVQGELTLLEACAAIDPEFRESTSAQAGERRLAVLTAAVDNIRLQLARRTVHGTAEDHGAFHEWRSKALTALQTRERERRALKLWLDQKGTSACLKELVGALNELLDAPAIDTIIEGNSSLRACVDTVGEQLKAIGAI